MDLGLQGLDLAGEVGRDLPPAIALGLEELPHAGVLGLQGAGEMRRSRRRSVRRAGHRGVAARRVGRRTGWPVGGSRRQLGQRWDGSAAHGQRRPPGVCRKGIAVERVDRDERRLRFHSCAAPRTSVSRGRRQRRGPAPSGAPSTLGPGRRAGWLRTCPTEMSLHVYRPQAATVQTFCAKRSGFAGGRGCRRNLA